MKRAFASILSTWISTINAEGWHLYEDHVGQTSPLVYQPDYHSYPAYLTSTPVWTYFQIPLATFSPRTMQDNPTLRALAIRYLLRLNDVLYRPICAQFFQSGYRTDSKYHRRYGFLDVSPGHADSGALSEHL